MTFAVNGRRLLPLLLFFSLAPAASAAPTFGLQSGVRISSGVPQAATGSTSSQLRLFFLRDFKIWSATSTDGLTFSEEADVRVSSGTPGNASVVFSSITSAAVLPADTGFRMLYTAANDSGNFQIVSATSSDGLGWANDAAGVAHPPTIAPGFYAGSVRLVALSTTGWRIFYVQATSGADPSTFRVFTATSGDQGLTWSPSKQIYTDAVRDIALMPLSDGALRLLYTAPLTGQTTATVVLSALSPSALTPAFTREAGVRLSTDVAQGGFLAPLPVRANPDYEWRLYQGYQSATSTIPVTVSALADAPAPETIAPADATRSDAPAAHTIAGDIFSTSVSVVLRRSGETDIVGTDVTRVSDRAITATFDARDRTTGAWDVVVINGDGKTGTLVNGFNIDIAAGTLSVVDNVFHPKKGETAKLNATIFEAGHVEMKLYTLDGRLVRTLQDGDLPLGATTVTWDGANDEGNLVASGVYYLRCKGPRLDAKQKIVVIK